LIVRESKRRMAEAVSPIARVKGAKQSAIRRLLKPTVFVLCLLPFAWLLYRTLTNQLSANPVEDIIRTLGDWALRFLLIALAVTPARILTGWNELARLRRMIGLFAFTYVVLHVLAYVGIDQHFDMKGLLEDVAKRIYITFGMAALAMLIPLAATSTDGMIRRLGGLRWRKLHLLVYPAGIAGVIHYFLMIKAGYMQPLIYALILSALFGVRLYKRR
jgi:sulfoxide reductase heme-binding subunit YedZ